MRESEAKGWVIIALLILGAIIYFFQGLFQIMVPLSILLGVLAIMAAIATAVGGSNDYEIAGWLLVGCAVCVVLAFISYQIGYGFGNTTIGNASKTFFDLYTHPLGTAGISG